MAKAMVSEKKMDAWLNCLQQKKKCDKEMQESSMKTLNFGLVGFSQLTLFLPSLKVGPRMRIIGALAGTNNSTPAKYSAI